MTKKWDIGMAGHVGTSCGKNWAEGVRGNFREQGLSPCIQSRLDYFHKWSGNLFPLANNSNTGLLKRWGQIGDIECNTAVGAFWKYDREAQSEWGTAKTVPHRNWKPCLLLCRYILGHHGVFYGLRGRDTTSVYWFNVPTLCIVYPCNLLQTLLGQWNVSEYFKSSLKWRVFMNPCGFNIRFLFSFKIHQTSLKSKD